jgi:hypothetical protein
MPSIPIHKRQEKSQVGKQFMKNPLRKTLWAFIEVVDSSEMYKFGINILTHFS